MPQTAQGARTEHGAGPLRERQAPPVGEGSVEVDDGQTGIDQIDASNVGALREWMRRLSRTSGFVA